MATEAEHPYKYQRCVNCQHSWATLRDRPDHESCPRCGRSTLIRFAPQVVEQSMFRRFWEIVTRKVTHEK